MPLVYHNGQSIFFAHIPKAGGTSVEKYLEARFGALTIIDKNKHVGVRGTGLITPATHLAAVDIKELVPHDLTYGFAVVRDPLTRLQSEYRYQTGISRMSKLGFSAWLKVVLTAVRMEPRLYENHLRPQSDLIPDGSDIFRLEDGFDGMIAALDKVTGTAVPELTVPHVNARKKEPIQMSRNDVTTVLDFYAADYEQFGYTKPDLTQYPNTGSGWTSSLARPLAAMLVSKQRRDWVR